MSIHYHPVKVNVVADTSIHYHLGKANMVVDIFTRICMHGTLHHKKEERELAKNVHRLAWLRVQFIYFKDDGVFIWDGSEPSLIEKVKEKQDHDHMILQLKEDVYGLCKKGRWDDEVSR